MRRERCRRADEARDGLARVELAVAEAQRPLVEGRAHQHHEEPLVGVRAAHLLELRRRRAVVLVGALRIPDVARQPADLRRGAHHDLEGDVGHRQVSNPC